MAAPPIELNRGPVTYSMTPIELRGFRINASITQSAHEADWVLSASTVMFDASVVADNDKSFRKTLSETVPYNEASALASAEAKLQALVDSIYDVIPTP
jgi:hypothetical protein